MKTLEYGSLQVSVGTMRNLQINSYDRRSLNSSTCESQVHPAETESGSSVLEGHVTGITHLTQRGDSPIGQHGIYNVFKRSGTAATSNLRYVRKAASEHLPKIDDVNNPNVTARGSVVEERHIG